jgi:hypothetical protein
MTLMALAGPLHINVIRYGEYVLDRGLVRL